MIGEQLSCLTMYGSTVIVPFLYITRFPEVDCLISPFFCFPYTHLLVHQQTFQQILTIPSFLSCSPHPSLFSPGCRCLLNYSDNYIPNAVGFMLSAAPCTSSCSVSSCHRDTPFTSSHQKGTGQVNFWNLFWFFLVAWKYFLPLDIIATFLSKFQHKSQKVRSWCNKD